MKKKKPTPMEIHCPDYDISAILSDPKGEEIYQKHFKGDRINRSPEENSK